MTDTPIGDVTMVPVELWKGRAWISQGIDLDSVMQLMREVMLRWWRRNITKVLCRFSNQTEGQMGCGVRVAYMGR